MFSRFKSWPSASPIFTSNMMADLRRLLFPVVLGASMLWAAGAGADAPTPTPGSNVLRVLVDGVTSAQGHVRVDVCVRDEFLKDCAYSGESAATIGVTTVVIKDLPPDTYAVQAYHDRNDNRSVDRNFLGFPTELVGFSNDAPVHLAPPKFKAAAFAYNGGDQTISLRLRRLRP